MSPLTPGTYSITNFKFHNVLVLPDDNRDSNIVGRPEENSVRGKWDVSRLGNGRYTILNQAIDHFAGSAHGAGEGDSVYGGERARQLTITETKSRGRYTISPLDADLFWGLPDGETDTPIVLAVVATDTKNQWMFTPIVYMPQRLPNSVHTQSQGQVITPYETPPMLQMNLSSNASQPGSIQTNSSAQRPPLPASNAHVYIRNLILKGNGCPLYIPEPCGNSPIYRTKGVRIGDVGFVTDDGDFEMLFNIRASVYDPINVRGVPDGFEKIDLHENDIKIVPNHFKSGTIIASVTTTTETDTLLAARHVVVSGGHRLLWNTSEGAVLHLPHGSTRLTCNPELFRDHAIRHGYNWYRYALQARHCGVRNGALCLITGIDKTDTWMLGTFSQVPPGSQVSLCIETDMAWHEHFPYSWSGASPIMRSGDCRSIVSNTAIDRADMEQDDAVFRSDAPGGLTHSVFVRGFKISLRQNLWAYLSRSPFPAELSLIQYSAPEDFAGGQDRGHPPGASSSVSSIFSSFFSAWRRGGDNPGEEGQSRTFSSESISQQPGPANKEAMVEYVPTALQVDPAATVNDLLLNLAPEAQVAVIHDDECHSLMQKDDADFPDTSELAARLNRKYLLDVRTGSVSLLPAVTPSKHGPRKSSFPRLSPSDQRSSLNDSYLNSLANEQKAALGAFSQEKAERIRLGKGRWSNNLFGIQAHSNPRSTTSSRTYVEDDFPDSSPTAFISPPRKLAIVDATRHHESLESLSQFPRKPSLRPRPNFGEPRRHSTKPGNYRGTLDDPRNHNDSADSRVPFPRTVSGEHGPGTVSSSSVDSRPNADGLGPNDRPRLPRGRLRDKAPLASSYDELDVRPTRSRFESIANLSFGGGNASAGDLMTRNSMDGSAVRKTLLIKEEGQPPTHFQLGNCIGRGQFGSVYRALNLNTGQMVAVKRVRLEGLKEEEVTQLMRDVDLVKRLSHPSIVKYEGMARDDDTLNIVLEYAENGSLGQTLKAFGKLNERLVAGYVVKILEGLHYLHQSNVVHGNLKAANILTTKHGSVKLSDLGVSLNLCATERETGDVAGTPNWMAPEVIELKGATTKSDIWSLGCTAIELLTGRPPYADIANSLSVMYRIVDDERPPLPEDCTPLLRDFLEQCFNKDPAKRPTAEDLCEHQWLKKTLAAHEELRRQDSIPFLRRVSADYQKEAARHLPPLEIPGTPTSDASRADGIISDYDPISPREHSFVKTSFGKPVTCRVCLLGVKKSAIICEQCSLVAHAKCSVNAPPTCDLRAQQLLYAQYAGKGNPGNVYHDPLDILRDIVPTSPTSEASSVTGTQSTSVDNLPQMAFKFMAPFRGSRTSLTPEPGQSASAPTPPSMPQEVKRKVTTPRPQSPASDSTAPDTSSIGSTATAVGSFSSRLDVASIASENPTDTRMTGSQMSDGGHSETFRSPQLIDSSVSGHPVTQEDSILSSETRTQKKRNKDPKSGCAIQ